MALSNHILIVDDEKFLCSSLSRLLRKNGYITSIATSGEDAISTLQAASDHFALALVDLHMPQMDGENTAKQLKKINPHLKIIMMTGYSPNLLPDVMPENQLITIGDAFLFKPFESGAVLEMVRSLIG